MRDVQPRFANLLRKIYIAVHDVRFGGGGHATQAETKAGRPFMHGTAFGEARVLTMLHDRQIQFSAEAQSRAHDFVIADWLTIATASDSCCTMQADEMRNVRPRPQ